MFGLHGMITPGQEDVLKTNGGLMYYQYNGSNIVSEMTNRNGDEIEHYRYDAFGNILTGITAPYNSTTYTGQQYDDKAGLLYMNARWYNPGIGRFLTEDTYPWYFPKPTEPETYRARFHDSWEYYHLKVNYDIVKNEETGETEYHQTGYSDDYVNFSESYYSTETIVKKSSTNSSSE